MAENDPIERGAMPNVEWRDVPSFFMETVLGTARLGGVARIACGEMVFDPTPGATLPKYRHTINWMIPMAAIPAMIESLQSALTEEGIEVAADGSPK